MNQPNHLDLLNAPTLRSFVSPSLCEELKALGFPAPQFNWKIVNGSIALHTDLFDLDDYYKQTVRSVDAISNATVIPAYQESDIEPYLPKYFLTCDRKNGYCLWPMQHGVIGPRNAQRKADLFAIVVRDMVTKGVIRISSPENQTNAGR